MNLNPEEDSSGNVMLPSIMISTTQGIQSQNVLWNKQLLRSEKLNGFPIMHREIKAADHVKKMEGYVVTTMRTQLGHSFAIARMELYPQMPQPWYVLFYLYWFLF
jgi:hypothetical protein